MTKTGIVVGGKRYVKSAMDLTNIFRIAGIKIKAIDPLGSDIREIIKKTDSLDYLFLERHSSIETRLELIRNLKHLRCNVVLFKLNKKVHKTKFYELYTKDDSINESFNEILDQYFNTRLREPCTLKKNKLKYRIYLLQEWFLDLRSSWARKYYLSYC